MSEFVEDDAGEFVSLVPVPLPLLEAVPRVDADVLRVLLFLLLHQWRESQVGAPASLPEIVAGSGVWEGRILRVLGALAEQGWVRQTGHDEWALDAEPPAGESWPPEG